jgi:hypothetical protein
MWGEGQSLKRLQKKLAFSLQTWKRVEVGFDNQFVGFILNKGISSEHNKHGG